jgi:hypothetical protein
LAYFIPSCVTHPSSSVKCCTARKEEPHIRTWPPAAASDTTVYVQNEPNRASAVVLTKHILCDYTKHTVKGLISMCALHELLTRQIKNKSQTICPSTLLKRTDGEQSSPLPPTTPFARSMIHELAGALPGCISPVAIPIRTRMPDDRQSSTGVDGCKADSKQQPLDSMHGINP